MITYRKNGKQKPISIIEIVICIIELKLDFVYCIIQLHRTSFISSLHDKRSIISRNVLDSATGSPCSVWGCEWINYVPPVRFCTSRFVFLNYSVWCSGEDCSIDFLYLFMFLRFLSLSSNVPLKKCQSDTNWLCWVLWDYIFFRYQYS